MKTYLLMFSRAETIFQKELILYVHIENGAKARKNCKESAIGGFFEGCQTNDKEVTAVMKTLYFESVARNEAKFFTRSHFQMLSKKNPLCQVYLQLIQSWIYYKM